MSAWQNGLCGGCCGGPIPTCLGAWFCSPCLYGRVDQRLDTFPNTDKDQLSNCSAGCWIFCAASCFHLGWIPLLITRGETRDRFGIRGNCCTDCLAAYFCAPCSIAQMNTEIKDRAVPALAAQAQEPLGYMGHQGPGMVYAAPQQQYGVVGGAPQPDYYGKPPTY